MPRIPAHRSVSPRPPVRVTKSGRTVHPRARRGCMITGARRRAVFWGLFWSGLLAVAIFVGSRNLRHIDAALVGYTFACLFAAFAVAYRYSMWLQRPPTRLYWRAGWQAFLKPGHLWANVKHLAARFVRLFLLNEFILRRSRPRGF